MSTSGKMGVLVAVLMLGGAATTFGEGAPPSAQEREAQLIAVLKSDAPHKEKADACRELARIATKDAIAPLAALLPDEKLSHMARYGLETIADPAVDDVLRQALGTLKGRPLVGIIGSIGMRRDAKAVDALAKLLLDTNPDVVQTAARSLGKIGTSAAAKALGDVLANVSVPNQLACCEGLLRCAETLSAKGEKDEALSIYDRLRSLSPAPHQVRAGGLRGAILLRGKDGLPILLAAVRGNDLILVEAAVRTSLELPLAEVTPALAGELGKGAADKQILLIQTLGQRGDAAALPALSAAAKAGDKTVRVAALRALSQIAKAPAAMVFVELLGDAEKEVAQAAQAGLVALPGAEVDTALAAMMGQADAAVRTRAIEMLGQRRTASSLPAFLKAAEDADDGVRLASIKALGDTAGSGEMPATLALLVKAKAPQDLEALEGAVASICTRLARPAAGQVVIQKAVYGGLPDGPSANVTKKVAELVKAGAVSVDASNDNFGDPANGVPKKLRVEYSVDGTAQTKTVGEGESVTFTAAVTPPACVDALCEALTRAPAPSKVALLRVLRSVGGSKALVAVRAAAKDPTAEIKDTALRALCEWPTVEALPDVAELAKSSADPKVKTLALRGYLHLIPLQNVADAQKLAAIKDAMALAQRKEEKRLAMAALGAIPSVDALALVTPQLANPDLKEEACMAAVAIAEKIAKTHPTQVAEAMKQVTSTATNQQVLRRARALLGQPRGQK